MNGTEVGGRVGGGGVFGGFGRGNVWKALILMNK